MSTKPVYKNLWRTWRWKRRKRYSEDVTKFAETEKNLAKTHPKKNPNVSSKNQINQFLLIHRGAGVICTLFGQHEPGKLEKKNLLSGKLFFLIFLPISWQQRFFGSRKIYDMVNWNLGRLPIYDGKSLDQWVTGKSSSTFLNAVGSLPNFKMSLQKFHVGQNFEANFFGKLFVFVTCPGLCENGTDTLPRLGHIGIWRKHFKMMSRNRA